MNPYHISDIALIQIFPAYREKKKHFACRTRSSSRFISTSVAGVSGWPSIIERPFANSGSELKGYDCSLSKTWMSEDWAIVAIDVEEHYELEFEMRRTWGRTNRGSPIYICSTYICMYVCSSMYRILGRRDFPDRSAALWGCSGSSEYFHPYSVTT